MESLLGLCTPGGRIHEEREPVFRIEHILAALHGGSVSPVAVFLALPLGSLEY